MLHALGLVGLQQAPEAGFCEQRGLRLPGRRRPRSTRDRSVGVLADVGEHAGEHGGPARITVAAEHDDQA